jgi:hypothetical protein
LLFDNTNVEGGQAVPMMSMRLRRWGGDEEDDEDEW